MYRVELDFNNGWEFKRYPLGTVYDDVKNDEFFEPVSIPHDFLIYDTNELYADASGWYKKVFSINKLSDRRYFINFDGVYMDSSVYCNSVKVGTWEYGYSAFEFELTDFLNEGINTIYVEIRHKSPNTRWYSGAGIFRNVVFKEVPLTYIDNNGVYVSSQLKEDGSYLVHVDTKVVSQIHNDHFLTYGLKLLKSRPSDVGTISKGVEPLSCIPLVRDCDVKTSSFTQDGDSCIFRIENPYVWDITSPNLYELTVFLHNGDEIVDSMTVRFGLRDISFDPNTGFWLNGRSIKLYGVCEHHDLGCLGAAFNRQAMRRKILILKAMGVNAIRTSHNMPAKEFMELADEMGILIDSEAFDMWLRQKTEFDYSRFFKTCHEKDIESWICRDRNHPSIIMWSIGNEINDCHSDESAVELTAHLRSCVEKWDYRHNAFITFASNYLPWEGAQRCADKLELAGYNYADKYYDEHHARYPYWCIYGSETASTLQSRGIYHFPYSASVLSDDDEQCSCLGNCTTGWGAESSEYTIYADRDHAFSAGQFIWTGFDYIGEPTPYQTKNSYFGQIDTAGFPKDTYYIYKAEWTDVSKEPFVHVFPYWDFNDGQTVDVRIATNCAMAELFVNGVSLGKRLIDHQHGKELCPTWQTKYQKGELLAVAYDQFGNEVVRELKHSFSDAYKLKIRSCGYERERSLSSDKHIFLEIYAVDANGYEVDNAVSRVYVSVKGSGVLKGLDNGDSTDFEQYICFSRRMFSGKLLAVIERTSERGCIDVEVSSPGLIGCHYEALDVYTDAGPDWGIEHEAKTSDLGTDVTEDIPIRKLLLKPRSSTLLNDSERDVTFDVEVFPKNASYTDIGYELVNDIGVRSNLATLKESGRSVTVSARGDGRVWLRAYWCNGSNKPRHFSVYDIEISGLGKVRMNPYEFIPGSLYSDSKGDVGNGNEKGVSTPRGEDSYIGYENLDFGDDGSDTIEIPIFALNDDAYYVGIWEGRPYEKESELLFEGYYQKPSIWNVYQEETFKLKRKIKGISSVYFTAHDKFHVKGFVFK